MRWGTRWGLAGSVLLAVLPAVLLAGCASPAAEPTPVPTFTGPATTTSPPAGAGAANGSVPTDCAAILTVGDLEALLGLPLGSVAVRTTIGIAEPSVGRTERVACQYTGTAASPARGTLLELNIARYVDAAAAAAQWDVNTSVESGERRDVPIGAAAAALFDRERESVLMVTYDDDTLTFVLPEGPRPGDRPRGDVLVDLALRILAVVGPTPAPSAPSTTTSAPAVAAG